MTLLAQAPTSQVSPASPHPSPNPAASLPEPRSGNMSFFEWIGYAVKLIQSKPAEKINTQVKDRYYGLISKEELQDKISFGEHVQLTKQLQDGKEMDLNAIRQSGSAKELDQKMEGVQKFTEALVGANTPGTVGGEAVESPFFGALVYGGGLIGLLAFVWWLKSSSIWSEIPEKLWGDEGVYQQVLEAMGKAKPKVSQSDLFLYQKALDELEKYAKQAISIDNDKFGQTEFLVFAKVQYFFKNDSGNYQGLKPYLYRLQSAFKAHRIFTTLAQIEMGCMGSKQQAFYDYCHQLLLSNVSGEALTQQVALKLTEMVPQVKTDAGKIHLENYAAALDELAPDPTAIAIINRFKGDNTGDYATLKTIVEAMGTLKEAEVSDLRTVMHLTMAYYDDFEVLGDIIDLPEERRSPDTYARLLQYIALEKRHQLSFMQFQGLIEALRLWYKPFRVVASMREAYPAEQYRQPKLFSYPIPGFELYKKYKNSLMDQRTGRSFVVFDAETEEAANAITPTHAVDPNTSEPSHTELQGATNLQNAL